VRSPHWERLRPWLVALGAEIEPAGEGRWWVRGPDTAAIGALAAEHRVPLHELAPRRSSLKEAYLRMTGSGG
jgi:ABC-2 type transport system ATP-binding protein